MTTMYQAPDPVTGRSRVVRAGVLIRKPIQYVSPGLRELAARSEVRPRVYYWHAPAGGQYDRGFGRQVEWEADLYSGYDWWSPPADRPAWQRSVDLVRQLRQDRPDVVLCFGWASPAARIGILFALRTGTPLLLYGDSNWRGPGGGFRSRVKRLLLRRMLRRAAGVVATGTFNRDFYIAHGMHPAAVHPGVLPADVESFYAAGERRRPVAGESRDRPVVIGFVGKFQPVKAPGDLVEAVAGLPAAVRWELWLIGDGSLRARLESTAAALGIADRVRFFGFRNCDELPELMSAVDILVMPSRQEPRGLAAVEAMAAGAAVVVSSATGVWGPGDVVRHGETGLVYPAGDVAALTACLRRLLADADLRRRLAAAGQARARRLGPREFADTATRAMMTVVRGGDRVDG